MRDKYEYFAHNEFRERVEIISPRGKPQRKGHPLLSWHDALFHLGLVPVEMCN